MFINIQSIQRNFSQELGGESILKVNLSDYSLEKILLQ